MNIYKVILRDASLHSTEKTNASFCYLERKNHFSFKIIKWPSFLEAPFFKHP